jgi:hypothetical protein
MTQRSRSSPARLEPATLGWMMAILSGLLDGDFQNSS